jgi:antitoxin (DNA-binding transcriptional repressor) of toxin-antitoxin stability system
MNAANNIHALITASPAAGGRPADRLSPAQQQRPLRRLAVAVAGPHDPTGPDQAGSRRCRPGPNTGAGRPLLA